MTALNIEDLRQAARRRLPRAIFEFIDGVWAHIPTLANDLLLTVTAATPKPVQLRFERMPKADKRRRADLSVLNEDVAKRANLSKGAVYFYFESKRAIFDALVGGLDR